MGNVISIASDKIRAIEGADIPTLKVSGTVGVDFQGSEIADYVTSIAGEFGEARIILDSFGGSASDAFAFYDTIRAGGIRLWVDGRGTVASAATIIMAAAGRKRSRLYPNAEYLIHSATGGDAEGVERANEKMEAIYAELSGMTKAEVRRIMKADKAMSAQDAKRMGFVGGIIELQKLAAHAVKTKPMAEQTTTVKRVFAIDRKLIAAALVTGEIEVEIEVDADMKAELDSAVKDLKAEQQKVADLEASVKTQPEAIEAAVKKATDEITAKHAEDLKAIGVESEKIKAELEEAKAKLKSTPAVPPIKPGPSANGKDVDERPLAERFPKLTAEQLAEAYQKARPVKA